MNHLDQTLIDVIKTQDAQQIKLAIDTLKGVYDSLTERIWCYGTKVKFEGRKGRMITGTIIKINAKSIKVDCKENGKWNVSKNLIQPA